MSSNQRIFYAIQQLGIKPDGSAALPTAIHGLQSCGMTTNFNLRQVFELGQISIYANQEDIPDVQITASKVLDGYPLMYHLATTQALTPTLIGRSTSKCVISLAIFPDTNTHAVGLPGSQVNCSGQFVSSLAYRIEVDGDATEDATFVGNDKVWANDPRIVSGNAAYGTALTFSGAFTNTDSPVGVGGIVRRNAVNFTTNVTSGDLNGAIADPDCTILPSEIHGITTSGVNPATSGFFAASIQSINISADLGRTALNELGHLGPYTRYVNFPTEVTTEVTVISKSGDLISATEEGILSTGTGCGGFQGNLRNGTIRVAMCNSYVIYCGIKNKLRSVNYTGGDTGGANVQITYTFSTFNDLTVMHSGDPNTNFSWANRSAYLIN